MLALFDIPIDFYFNYSRPPNNISAMIFKFQLKFKSESLKIQTRIHITKRIKCEFDNHRKVI